MKISISILLLCIILGFVLRMYHISENVGFDFDQEYAAQFAFDVVKVYPLRMIGQGLSVGGLFMGPWYFYFLVPFFLATNFHPIGGYFGSVFLGLAIIATYFFVLKDVFGTKVGLVAAFLRTFLLYGIFADLSLTPAFSSELLVVLTWWCFYKYWHKDYKFLLLLALIFGTYTSFHPILFPFYLVFFGLVLIKRNIPNWKYFIAFPVLFILPIVPLIMFEFFRRFMEIRTLLSLKDSGKSEIKTLVTLKDYVAIVWRSPSLVLGIGEFISPFALIGVLISIIKNKFHLTVVVLTVAVFVGYYFLLPTHVIDYYFLGPKIIIFVYICAAMGKIRKDILVLILIILFAVNIKLLSNWWARDFRVTLFDKDSVVAEIAKREPNNKMFVHYNVDPGQQFGLGYFQRFYKIVPAGKEGDPEYIITIPFDKQGVRVDYQSGSVGLLIKK